MRNNICLKIEVSAVKCVTLETEINVTGIVCAFRETLPKHFRYEGEKHNSWEFVFVEAGKILASAEDRKYVVHSGELICHKPMEYHNLSPYKGEARVVVLGFNCTTPQMAFFENKILDINPKQRFYINDIIVYAERFLSPRTPLEIVKYGFMPKRTDGSTTDSQALKNTVELLILSLYSSKTTQRDERIENYSQHLIRKNLAYEIKMYLNKNIGKRLSLLEISKAFSYSASTIKTVFKSETGESVMEYYNRLRLEKAENMLRAGVASTKEIAEQLGFNSPSHFTNFFKLHTGLSPKKYKEMNKHDQNL